MVKADIFLMNKSGDETFPVFVNTSLTWLIL